MRASAWEGLKRFILWDYPRAGWQYDVMVALILAFIFLTPREWFRDQPRVPRASRIAVLPTEHGALIFWIEAELLAGTPEEQRLRKAQDLLSFQTGDKLVIVRLEPVVDSEQEIRGFIAFAAADRAHPHTP
ncbi:MAG: hypothetical protein RMI94_07335 [Bryobacterales bacterium]|nr:hypothetical protein [Bryobacteraceae bacterium]MDW8130346.1 hypothetical protein [Bryobacterales bacterium]